MATQGTGNVEDESNSSNRRGAPQKGYLCTLQHCTSEACTHRSAVDRVTNSLCHARETEQVSKSNSEKSMRQAPRYHTLSTKLPGKMAKSASRCHSEMTH
eukprot:4004570-Amphidinium_carterae.3